MIRRPLAFSCGACLLGMASELFFKWTAAEIIFICALSFAAFAGMCIFSVGMSGFAVQIFNQIIKRNFDRQNEADSEKSRLICLFFVCVILFDFGMVHCYAGWNEESRLKDMAGEYIIVRGTVLEAAEKSDYCSLMVLVSETDRTGRLSETEKILINIYDEVTDIYKLTGKPVEASGMTELPSVRRNPKLFDYSVYLKTQGIYVVMESLGESVRVLNVDECGGGYKEIKYLGLIAEIKHIFKKNTEGCFEKDIAALLAGMVLGDNTGMSDDLYESFQKNGICHILAVSGLHVGALYGCISGVLGKRKNIFVDLIVIAVIIFYVSLAGFSPSSVRAALMIGIHIVSKNLRKRYDMLTASIVTMLIMTLYNPLLLLNLGFQLSFIAILTLAVVLPAVLRLWDNGLLSSLVLQAGIAPVSAYAFNYFSTLAFVVNIPVLFLGGILIPLGMLLLLISILNAGAPMFSDILGVLFQLVGICAEFFAKALLFINDLVFADNISYRYVVSPPLWLLLTYYGLGFFICSETFRIMLQRKQLKRIVICVVMIFTTCFSLGVSTKDGFENTDLVFLDVGQGDCLFLRTENGKTVMIDSGGSASYDVGEKILLPYCLKNGIDHIDFAVITHFHTDHYKGLESLANHITVEKLVLYEGNSVNAYDLEEKMNISQEDFIYLTKGDRLEISKDLVIEALYPEKLAFEEYQGIMSDDKDENSSCLVARVEFKGVSIMMTGDLDTEGEAKVIEANPAEKMKCHILKAAHHGSKYGSSEEFLQAVEPDIAVIQVGKNNYGHPNSGTLSRLKAYCEEVYRNDEQGAVGIEIKGKEGNREIKIHTMIER